ncbi:MAG TPA: hypothetical protein VFK20_00830 [Vicinamibacterales bacterium]|nr:hypothetical protein [Vicinamibacterales bacterium]
MTRIPRWFKVAYTIFVAVLVPYYWVTYTPWNFLYFCDVALLVALVGVWRESPLLVSTQAIGIIIPQLLWITDLATRTVGLPITGAGGVTSYMFDAQIPVFVRGLSLFHGWLPIVLVWLVARLGYDRRAFTVQSFFGVAVLLASYLLAPPPGAAGLAPAASANINYVYGIGSRTQTWIAPHAWFLLVATVVIAGFYLPAHLCFRRLFPTPESRRASYARARIL